MRSLFSLVFFALATAVHQSVAFPVADLTLNHANLESLANSRNLPNPELDPRQAGGDVARECVIEPINDLVDRFEEVEELSVEWKQDPVLKPFASSLAGVIALKDAYVTASKQFQSGEMSSGLKSITDLLPASGRVAQFVIQLEALSLQHPKDMVLIHSIEELNRLIEAVSSTQNNMIGCLGEITT